MYVQSHIMPLLKNLYTHFHHTSKCKDSSTITIHVTFIKNKDLLHFTLCFKYDFITDAHVVDIHTSEHTMDSP